MLSTINSRVSQTIYSAKRVEFLGTINRMLRSILGTFLETISYRGEDEL